MPEAAARTAITIDAVPTQEQLATDPLPTREIKKVIKDTSFPHYAKLTKKFGKATAAYEKLIPGPATGEGQGEGG